ncbi:hypothetical protein SAMN06314019_10323 [Epsilonproteobacteria bacterium SCGC AD-311-C15]|jgi:hypothetical protein|nr:hypothetical protein SAMN06314019_10323 [Epsilonproteobacteria bacterium SCGC AD-311-C15]
MIGYDHIDFFTKDIVKNFHLIGMELDNFKKSIDILIKSHKTALEQIDKSYEHIKDIRAQDVKTLDIMKHDSTSKIIIEAMLIKHMAYLEKMIVKMAFKIQSNEGEKVSPDFNYKGHFTDMDKAADYITLVSNDKLAIKQFKNWKIIKTFRTIRHELAHGHTIFVLKNGVIKDINKQLPLVRKFAISKEDKDKQKEQWHCELTSDIDILLIINDICINFYNEFKIAYLANYK